MHRANAELPLPVRIVLDQRKETGAGGSQARSNKKRGVNPGRYGGEARQGGSNARAGQSDCSHITGRDDAEKEGGGTSASIALAGSGPSGGDCGVITGLAGAIICRKTGNGSDCAVWQTDEANSGIHDSRGGGEKGGRKINYSTRAGRAL